MIEQFRYKTFVLYKYSNPTDTDLKILIDQLRPNDLLELSAWFNGDAINGLKESIRQSDECYLVFSTKPNQLHICAIMGITHEECDSLPWFLSTIHFPLIWREFSLWAKRMCAKNEISWYNYVLTTYTESHRWLRWLGFTIAENVIVERGGETFYGIFKEKGAK
jgi:hypothetical protein